jgi:hypothetical protein
MKTLTKRILTASSALGILLLSGCATTYHSQRFLTAGGYSEITTAPDAFMVTFKGNQYTSSEKVMQYALTRASELTLRNGYKYFLVVSSKDRTRGYNYTNTQNDVSELADTYQYRNSSNTGINVRESSSTYSGTITKPGLSINIKCFNDKPPHVEVIDAEYFLTNNEK